MIPSRLYKKKKHDAAIIYAIISKCRKHGNDLIIWIHECAFHAPKKIITGCSVILLVSKTTTAILVGF